MVIYTVTSRGLCCPDALSILHFAKLSDTSMDKKSPILHHPFSACFTQLHTKRQQNKNCDSNLQTTWRQEAAYET